MMKTLLCPVKKKIYQAAPKKSPKYIYIYQSHKVLIDPFINPFMHGRASWTPRAARHSVIGPESTQQIFHQPIRGDVLFFSEGFPESDLDCLFLIDQPQEGEI